MRVHTDGSLVLLTGDFDGDGRADLLSVGPSSSSVHYFDTTRELRNSHAFSLNAVLPCVGQLTDETRSDLAYPPRYWGEVGVLRGQADGTLEPIAYAPYQDEGLENAVFATLDALPTEGLPPGEELMILVGTEVLETLSFTALTEAPGSASDLVKEGVAAGRLDESLPCELMVLGYEGDSAVHVYSPCARNARGEVGWNVNGAMELPSVLLAEGDTLLGSVFVGDWNADAHLDLLARGRAGWHAALGLGNGTFVGGNEDFPNETTLIDSSDPAAELGVLEESRVLAFGDLNGDAEADLVTPVGLYVSDPAAPEGVFVEVPNSTGELWSMALVGDFNGTPPVDVVVAGSGSRRLTFLNSVGSGVEYDLAQSDILLDGIPKQMVAGDFDGDVIQDIAVAHASSDERGGDDLSVLWGRPFGAPEPARHLAHFESIRQVVGFRGTHIGDAATDLALLSDTDVTTARMALFVGSADRQLLSPFELPVEPGGQGDYFPVHVFIGQFDEHPHSDLAVLTQPAQQEASDSGSVERRETLLWWLHSEGEAELQQARAIPSAPLPKSFGAGASLGFAIDLDEDSIDEVVLVGPWVDNGGIRTAVLTARVGEEGWQLDEQPQLFDELVAFQMSGVAQLWSTLSGLTDSSETRAEEVWQASRGSPVGSLTSVADVDGDGTRDLLVLAFRREDVDAVWTSELVLMRGVRNRGQLDVEGRVVLSVPDGIAESLYPQAFALVELDGDPAPEIAVVGNGLLLADIHAGSGELRQRLWLPSVTGSVVAAGDFDGDGVADLAVGGQNTVQLFWGASRVP